MIRQHINSKFIILAALAISLVLPPHSSAESTAPSQFIIKPKIINWGFVKAGNRKVDTIIIHTIHSPLAKNDLALSSIVNILKKHRASAHYLILRDGSVHQLVAENNIAYHSGWSRLPVPPYTRFLDKSSIGIELANRENTTLTDAQYESLAKLVKNIKTRHQIKNILGHKDVTSYKTDPWNFDWSKFKAMIAEDQK